MERPGESSRRSKALLTPVFGLCGPPLLRAPQGGHSSRGPCELEQTTQCVVHSIVVGKGPRNLRLEDDDVRPLAEAARVFPAHDRSKLRTPILWSKPIILLRLRFLHRLLAPKW